MKEHTPAEVEFDGVIYTVDGHKLEPGMVVRRYDPAAPGWFEGEIGSVRYYDYEKQAYTAGLAFVVAGFAPSPLQAGQLIEIVSKAELYNREMDERNRMSRRHVEKPWLPLHDGE